MKLSYLGTAVHHIWRTKKPRHVGITTFALEYPRYIHSELLTHRMFSRNASSSRAIPVQKLIEKVENAEWMPPFASNRPGMQAGDALLGSDLEQAQTLWLMARDSAVNYARRLMRAGVHKQWVNRVLEPYSTISTCLTLTDDQMKPFLDLREHPDAEPTFHFLARQMRESWEETLPAPEENHLPFLDEREISLMAGDGLLAFAISAARCARVSYDNHFNKRSFVEDLNLFARLALHNPPHASPLEHCARALRGIHANFTDWQSFRHMGLDPLELETTVRTTWANRALQLDEEKS